MSELGAQGSNIPLWPANTTQKEPVLFLKPTTSYVEEGAPIVLPPPSVGCVHCKDLDAPLVVGDCGGGAT